MSVMQHIMETVAKFVPDQKSDPLIHHEGYLGQSLARVDGEIRYGAKRASLPNSRSKTWRMRRSSIAPLRKGKFVRSIPDRLHGSAGCLT